MASLLHLFLFLFLSFIFSFISSHQIPMPYVVYMGSLSEGPNQLVDDDDDAQLLLQSAHLQLLSSVIPREESERIQLIHHYHNALKGFSAMLTEKEASLLSGDEEVVSVFRDPVVELHTTRSWDFLKENSGIFSTHFSHDLPSNDIIIGIVDTGIWPESPSFKDEGIGKIPSRWKGTCMEGPDFKKSSCNRKLIGARYYNMPLKSTGNMTKVSSLAKSDASPRDSVGHGTHTSSIAGGARVTNASYYGLAPGMARGGLPSSRIAMYKACSVDGCVGSIILKAIDDAVKDGVDIISISIGISLLFQSEYLSDPIAIGAFHAQQMGVMVVCSSGNDGPDSFTVTNTAPWIFTVAASSIDRDFQSTVLLGNGKEFQGSAINFSNLTLSKTFPLLSGKDVPASNFTPLSEAWNCRPGSLDPKKVAGKIVLCIDNDPTVSRRIKKLVVEDAGAKGMILINEDEKGVPFDSGVFPFAEVGNKAGYKILKYMNATKKPTATILPTVNVSMYKPAPVVAYFSSRGPGGLTENILKPDIMAPGVAILAAMTPKTEAGKVFIGEKPSEFGIRSGTSMACPHVTGAAAFIKSVHPGWSPSMIKSALMTTATWRDNMGKALRNSSGYTANPHEMGVGELNLFKALNPGLVLETTTTDYLQFLCYCNYSKKTIKSIAKTNFSCPKNSSPSQISNINYPSISIGSLDRSTPIQTIQRILTNVGQPNTTYLAHLEAPNGLVVKVSPKKIAFKEGMRKFSFKASFYGQEAPSGYNFGSITWSDGEEQSVRIVFAVNVIE